MTLFNMLFLLMITGMISCDDKGVVRLVERVGEDVVLPCSLGPEVDIEQTLFDWIKDQQEVFLYNGGFYQSGDKQFKGRVSHFPDKLKNGNASIIIRNLQRSDSGNYSCFVKRLQEHRFYVELVVGIFAEPRVMKSEITKDQMLLQCEVRGAFPKPQISWIDSDGFVLPAEEKLEDSDGLHYPPTLMLQTNVTKDGIFHCRVTQKELNHITEAQISVFIFNDKTATRSNGVLHGVAIVCLTVVVLGLVAVGMCWWCRRRPKRQRPNAINSTMDKRPVVERPNAINSCKDKRPAVAKPEETRELNQEAEPEADVKTPIEEF